MSDIKNDGMYSIDEMVRRKKEENKAPFPDGESLGADEDTIEIPMQEFENIQLVLKERDVNQKEIKMLTKRVEEYQTDIKYFKDTLTEALSSMKESLKSIQQQNYISAKEKGFDKE